MFFSAIGSTLRSQLLRIPTKMAESQPFSLYKSCDYLLCCTSGEPLRRNNILPTNERMQIEEASIKWRLLTGLISGLQRTRTLPFLWLHSIPWAADGFLHRDKWGLRHRLPFLSTLSPLFDHKQLCVWDLEVWEEMPQCALWGWQNIIWASWCWTMSTR